MFSVVFFYIFGKCLIEIFKNLPGIFMNRIYQSNQINPNAKFWFIWRKNCIISKNYDFVISKGVFCHVYFLFNLHLLSSDKSQAIPDSKRPSYWHRWIVKQQSWFKWYLIYLEKSVPLAIGNQTKLILGFDRQKYLYFLLKIYDGSKINFDLFGEITLYHCYKLVWDHYLNYCSILGSTT